MNRFLIDTGAPLTAISEDTAIAAGVPQQSLRRTIMMRTANGSVRAELSTIEELRWDGDRLKVSYYHGFSINDGQTTICMGEPKTYEIWRDMARRMHAAVAPPRYVLSMDEIREGGTCEECFELAPLFQCFCSDFCERKYDRRHSAE